MRLQCLRDGGVTDLVNVSRTWQREGFYCLERLQQICDQSRVGFRVIHNLSLILCVRLITGDEANAFDQACDQVLIGMFDNTITGEE